MSKSTSTSLLRSPPIIAVVEIFRGLYNFPDADAMLTVIRPAYVSRMNMPPV